MKNIIKVLLLVCLQAYVIGVYSQEIEKQEFLEQANSIVQYDNTEVEYLSATHVVCKRKRVVTVLNENGKDAANYYNTFCEKMSSLQKFSGVVTNASGKVIHKIKKNDLFRTEFSTDLATDVYRYIYKYTSFQYPYTVTYEWEEKSVDGILSFPAFIPQETFRQAVVEAVYSLKRKPTMPIRYKVVNGEPEIKEEVLKDGNILTEYRFTKLPVLLPKAYSLPFVERFPIVYAVPLKFAFEETEGSMESWKAFGEWQYRLLGGRDELPVELIQQLKTLTASCKTDRERVQMVYDYMAKNTRYVSIQLGLGGLQPMPAMEVYRTGFGDCKGLSNYMHAMLKALDIPSNYAIISTTNKNFFSDFPSASQANHVILQVPIPNDTLWLECTNPRLPFGYVHNDIAGHNTLLITPEGGVLYRLPVCADSLNTQVNHAKVVVNSDGSALLKVKQVNHQYQYEDNFDMSELPVNKQKDRIRSQIDLIQCDITAIQCEEKKEQDPSLSISYTLQTDQYGNRTGKRLFLPLNVLRNDFKTLQKDENRQEEIFIEYGFLDTDSIEITLPEGFELESFSAPFEQKSVFGHFSSVAKRRGNSVKVVQQLFIKRGRYGKELYDELVKFRSNVYNHYQAEIILRKSE